MKKFLALFLAMLMVLSVFSACGGSNDGAQNVNEPADGQLADGEAATPAEEISFPLMEPYTIDAFAFSLVGSPVGETVTMKTMEERTNIHWNFTYASDAELQEKRNLSFNGGDYYDVYFKSGIDAAEAYKYGVQGILIPLNDYIDAYMPNLKAILDEEGLWNEITSPDGNIYALPQFNGKGATTPSTFVNKNWLDKLGLEMPTTPEEFADVLRAFITEDPNGNGEKDEYGIYCPGGAVEYTFPIFGIAMDYNTMSVYDGGKLTYIPSSQQYKDFLAFWATAYKESLINQDCFTATWDDMNAIGATGDTIGVMCTWGPYQHVGTERDEYYDILLPFNNANTVPVSSGVQYGGLCITDKCENPAAICAWADYFYCEEGAILAHMGVEGETFTVDEENKYHWILGEKWGEDANTLRTNAVIFGWYPAPINRCIFASEGQSDPEELYLYTLRQKLVERSAEPLPALSWTEEELEEKSTLVATINPYYYEYMAQVITGQLDLESSWDTYISNLEAMGVARLNEIDQAAYDRWLAEHS